LFVAYAVIGSMAVVPIYSGSLDSLDRLKSSHKKKDRPQFAEFSDSEDEDDDETESVSAEDAYMFPVYGSAALFSMYLVFKYLNKDWVNLLLSGYFAILGVAALSQVSTKVVKGVTGIKLPLYHLNLVYRSKSVFDLRFTNLHLAMLGVSAVATAFYLFSKNWVVSNLFGLAFSFSAINLIRLDSFKSGMIMLAGLFVYDIFWVFGTEVMVSVAKNFDAPIKVVFPKDLFPSDGKLQFTMLGLGDIVVPGIFVALCLRFDRHRYLAKLGYSKDKPLPPALHGRHRGFPFPTPYFNACMAAYVAGLATTITVMHTFKAAQPALLYLSPACILSVVITALARGELSDVFGYSEEKPKEDKGANEDD
ncbi:peptidase A22B, signal peptide peptidase, partial [Martensiomyces pterosporus]